MIMALLVGDENVIKNIIEGETLQDHMNNELKSHTVKSGMCTEDKH